MRVLAVLAFLSGAGTAFAVLPPGLVTPRPLNDSGVTLFTDDTLQTFATEPATHPGQDAHYGRDAAARAGTLAKVGGGSAGFDFTKIANNGTVLPPEASLGTGATDWGCTRDNVTGLMWEVKVADPTHLRYMGHGYSWFNSSGLNGGDPGWPSLRSTCHTQGRCDTEKLVQDVNAAQLCGYHDWRMPRAKELKSIVDHSADDLATLAVDVAYFPNLAPYHPEFGGYIADYWTGTPSALYSGDAWWVSLDSRGFFVGSNGYKSNGTKSNANSVMVVRGRP